MRNNQSHYSEDKYKFKLQHDPIFTIRLQICKSNVYMLQGRGMDAGECDFVPSVGGQFDHQFGHSLHSFCCIRKLAIK